MIMWHYWQAVVFPTQGMLGQTVHSRKISTAGLLASYIPFLLVQKEDLDRALSILDELIFMIIMNGFRPGASGPGQDQQGNLRGSGLKQGLDRGSGRGPGGQNIVHKQDGSPLNLVWPGEKCTF